MIILKFEYSTDMIKHLFETLHRIMITFPYGLKDELRF